MDEIVRMHKNIPVYVDTDQKLPCPHTDVNQSANLAGSLQIVVTSNGIWIIQSW